MTEIDKAQQKREQTLLRIGAVCAILGAAVSVAAGIGFGNLTNESGTEAIMRYVSSGRTGTGRPCIWASSSAPSYGSARSPHSPARSRTAPAGL